MSGGNIALLANYITLLYRLPLPLNALKPLDERVTALYLVVITLLGGIHSIRC